MHDTPCTNQEMLETSYRSKAGVNWEETYDFKGVWGRKVNGDANRYYIDWDAMEQVNKKTNRRREIRRVVDGRTDMSGAYAVDAKLEQEDEQAKRSLASSQVATPTVDLGSQFSDSSVAVVPDGGVELKALGGQSFDHGISVSQKKVPGDSGQAQPKPRGKSQKPKPPPGRPPPGRASTLPMSQVKPRRSVTRVSDRTIGDDDTSSASDLSDSTDAEFDQNDGFKMPQHAKRRAMGSPHNNIDLDLRGRFSEDSGAEDEVEQSDRFHTGQGFGAITHTTPAVRELRKELGSAQWHEMHGDFWSNVTENELGQARFGDGTLMSPRTAKRRGTVGGAAADLSEAKSQQTQKRRSTGRHLKSLEHGPPNEAVEPEPWNLLGALRESSASTIMCGEKVNADSSTVDMGLLEDLEEQISFLGSPGKNGSGTFFGGVGHGLANQKNGLDPDDASVQFAGLVDLLEQNKFYASNENASERGYLKNHPIFNFLGARIIYYLDLENRVHSVKRLALQRRTMQLPNCILQASLSADNFEMIADVINFFTDAGSDDTVKSVDFEDLARHIDMIITHSPNQVRSAVIIKAGVKTFYKSLQRHQNIALTLQKGFADLLVRCRETSEQLIRDVPESRRGQVLMSDNPSTLAIAIEFEELEFIGQPQVVAFINDRWLGHFNQSQFGSVLDHWLAIIYQTSIINTLMYPRHIMTREGRQSMGAEIDRLYSHICRGTDSETVLQSPIASFVFEVGLGRNRN